MRLFFSLPLPGPVLERLRGPLDEARRAGRGLSFGNLAQLHFTLAFLGEQPEAAVAPACEAAEAARGEGFELVIEGPGAFPSLSRPRVVWLGVSKGASELCALAERLRKGLVQRGLSFDEKPFRPHLTVARLKERGRVPEAVFGLLQGCRADFRAEELTLVHSTLGSGAHHEVLRHFPLGAPA
jgi:2'-5' RNA ligase